MIGYTKHSMGLERDTVWIGYTSDSMDLERDTVWIGYTSDSMDLEMDTVWIGYTRDSMGLDVGISGQQSPPGHGGIFGQSDSTVAITVDISKAFNSVPHDKLFMKLAAWGVD